MTNYSGVHNRVREINGSARNFRCQMCGNGAFHWAYDHQDPNEIRDSENRVYSLSVSHYKPLCVPCHKAFDAPFRFSRPATPRTVTPRKVITHERYLTAEDVAQHLGITVDQAREWARTGVIRAAKIAKKFLFRRADVDAFVDSRVVEVTP